MAIADPTKQLPIDITFLKLADWLVDRKKIPADWRKKLIPIHNRIAVALARLPKDIDFGFQTLNYEAFGYLEAKHVTDILKAAKPEARTFFGWQSGAASDWDAIVRGYEKEALFLGEGAQVMVQNVNYEIPYLRKQIAKIQQQLADLERKEAELKRNAGLAALKYQQACQDLQIKGHDVRSELVATSKLLSSIFSEVEELLGSELIGYGIDCYEAFVSYAYANKGETLDAVVPTLTKLRNKDLKGWLLEIVGTQHDQHEKVPLILEADHMPDHPDLNTLVEGESPVIDWDIGVLDSQMESTDGILNMLALNGANCDRTHVNTSVSVGEPKGGENGHTDKDYSEPNRLYEEVHGGQSGDLTGAGIQWDIDTVDELECSGQDGIQWEISIEGDDLKSDVLSPPDEDGMAEDAELKQSTIMRYFLNVEFRNSLLDDLLEIKTFLTLRIEEINRAETSALQNQVQAISPHNLQQYGSEVLRNMCEEVSKAIHLLTNKKTRNLILISTSSRYLHGLETSLNKKKQQEKKFLESLKDVGEKRLELRSTLAAIWPRLDSMLQRTRKIKELCERSISSMYDGRHINIIGEINNVLRSQQ